MKTKFLHYCMAFGILATIFSSCTRVQPEENMKNWLQKDATERPSLNTVGVGLLPLKADEAETIGKLIIDHQRAELKNELETAWNNKEVTWDKYSMKFMYKVFGEKPANGRSLYISMHGGGGAPPALNDQQWQNQIRLYEPKEGVYLAPRASTDTWNLWHQAHIDKLFDKIIQAAVLFADVDINKVYIMGYSAGGDGVYQLSRRMSDHWAAAAMMAGHPNEVTPEGVRNIGYCMYMGELDGAYNRNKIAANWKVLLDSLHRADPKGYNHEVHIVPGKGHWMERYDTIAVPWMAKFTRNPLPEKIVWKQDDVHYEDYYWLHVPAKAIKTGERVVVEHEGNSFNILENYSDTLVIKLNDKLVNLDKPVAIKVNGNEIFKGKVARTAYVLWNSLKDRVDENYAFSSELKIVNNNKVVN
ncbi:alpha/beta hydrolase [Puteibacter caeruleilacunae]|nr:alpha/beta hydrolase [Puteibacter caeruleilacunae]